MQLRNQDQLRLQTINYFSSNAQTPKLKKLVKTLTKKIAQHNSYQEINAEVQKFNNEFFSEVKKYIPEVINPFKVTSPIEKHIYSFLTDTDLTNLAINKMMARRTNSDDRFKLRIEHPIRRSIQEKRLLLAYTEGKPFKRSLLTKNIAKEIADVFSSLKNQGITNYQTLYAHYCKLNCHGVWALSEEQLILLSGNYQAIKNWFGKNLLKLERNEPLDHEGLRPYHYLALSGNVAAMQLYRDLGMDTSVKDWHQSTYQPYACFSGNPQAVCKPHEFKELIINNSGSQALLNETKSLSYYAEWSGDLRIIKKIIAMRDKLETSLFHVVESGNIETIKAIQKEIDFTHSEIWQEKIVEAIAESGRVQSLRGAINDLKLPQPKDIGHFAHAKPAILKMCAQELKYDMKKKDCYGDGLQHNAAMRGNVEALKACHKEYKLDMYALRDNQEGVEHLSAASGNPDALLYCADELKLNMQRCDESGNTVAHSAAESNNPMQLLICKLLNINLNSVNNTGHGINQPACFYSQFSMLLTFQMLKLPIHGNLSVSPGKLLQEMMRFYPQDFLLDEEKRFVANHSVVGQAINTLERFAKKNSNNSFSFFMPRELYPTKLIKKLNAHLLDFKDKPDYELFFFLNYYLMDLIQNRKLTIYDPLTAVIRFITNQTLHCILAKREQKVESIQDEENQSPLKRQRLT